MDMLINDNHNWYLLIAKDGNSGTVETHTHTCDNRVCLCVISIMLHSLYVFTHVISLGVESAGGWR